MKAEEINISIIIPHYNSPDSLNRLLESIGQHPGVEVIVIDDKSTKWHREWNDCVKNHANDTCHFFSNDSSGKGAGVARNIGLEKSRGRWVMFADADDFFLESWYQSVEVYFNSKYDVVYFLPAGENTFRHVPFKHLILEYVEDKYKSELRLRTQFFPPWSKLIRADLIKENAIRFDEVKYSNDVMFSAKVGCLATAITTDLNEIYCISEMEGSLTKQITEESILIRNDVSCRTYKFLKDILSYKDFNSTYVVNVPIITAVHLIKRKNWILFFKVLRQYKKYKIPFINLSVHNLLRLGRKII